MRIWPRLLGISLLMLVMFHPVWAQSNGATPLRPGMMPSLSSYLSNSSGTIAANAEAMIERLPTLAEDVSKIIRDLADPSKQGRTILGGSIELGLALIICLWLPLIVRRLTGSIRDNLLAAENIGINAVALLVLLDLLGVAVTATAAWVFVEGWFSGRLVPQNELAGELLAVVVFWPLAMIPVDAVLRPRSPRARLLALNDEEAAKTRRFLAITLLVALVMVGLLSGLRQAGMSFEHGHALGIGAGVIVASVLAFGFSRGRATIDRLLLPFIQTRRHAPLGVLLANWYWIAQVYVFLLLVSWITGSLAGALTLFTALSRTLLVLAIGFLATRVARALTGQIFTGPEARVDRDGGQLARRLIGAGVWAVAAVAIVEIWVVGLLGYVDPDDWDRASRSVLSAGFTLFVTYALWQYVVYRIDNHLGDQAGGPPPAEPGQVPEVSTRLKTMLPLLRIFLLGTLAVLAALIVLTELGINTAPLIAGASVFGLAISFGSQALVKDVVSGIFFMADDAFRVGEYIDTGRLRGVVEGMSVRSLRLRHQNGQIHTIPFGQLNAVTNFSRDWITTKFMVRFARDTDLESLRKAVKKIGQASVTDEEFGPEILAPLKLQGVHEIEQSALVCRFKFTTRPGKPTWVQRYYLKQLFEKLPEIGIRFADSSVTVNAGSVPATDLAVLGGGAVAAPAKLPPAAGDQAGGR